jgi:hypothetical protein
MKPDTNSVQVHLQQSHNGHPVDTGLLDATLLRRNCHTIETHHGHPVDGGLDWWVLMPFAPSVLSSLDRLAQAPVQGAR